MMRLVMEAVMVIALVSVMIFLAKIGAEEKKSARAQRDEGGEEGLDTGDDKP